MAHVPVDKKSNSILPPLLEIFPPETYPLREIGTGFTAQSAQGDDANACAAIALDMMLETRGTVYSAASSDGGSSMMDVEPFAVPDLPLPEDAAEVCCLCGFVGVNLLPCVYLRWWDFITTCYKLLLGRIVSSYKDIFRTCCYSVCGMCEAIGPMQESLMICN